MSKIAKHVFIVWAIIEVVTIAIAVYHMVFDPLHHPGSTMGFVIFLAGAAAWVIAFIVYKTKRGQG